MGHYYSRPLFFEMAKRAGYSFKEIKCLSYAELLSIFKPLIAFKNNIKQRQRKFILARIAGKRIELYDKEADKFLKQNFFKEEKPEIIRGFGVSLGQAKGKVIVIKKPSIVSGKKGYVLVTTMTTPELLPLMKNAVAVVTDEGGLTCHAAIVARELKIPCIVGTRIATTILKNGDMVQVDASKGIVRKL